MLSPGNPSPNPILNTSPNPNTIFIRIPIRSLSVSVSFSLSQPYSYPSICPYAHLHPSQPCPPPSTQSLGPNQVPSYLPPKGRAILWWRTLEAKDYAVVLLDNSSLVFFNITTQTEEKTFKLRCKVLQMDMVTRWTGRGGAGEGGKGQARPS